MTTIFNFEPKGVDYRLEKSSLYDTDYYETEKILGLLFVSLSFCPAEIHPRRLNEAYALVLFLLWPDEPFVYQRNFILRSAPCSLNVHHSYTKLMNIDNE